MKLETAKKLVAKKLPGYQVQRTIQTDAEALRQKTKVELISPSLQKLKRRYFGSNSASVDAATSTEDSGIVVVEMKEGQQGHPKAVVFTGGRLKGRQG
jgi:hypothetical protein